MKSRLYTFFIPLLISCHCYSQGLTDKEVDKLEMKLFSFLSKCDTVVQGDRAAEYLMCFIETDTSGAISDFHVLGDPENKDSVYSYLFKLKGSDFRNMQFPNWRYKRIIIPFISVGIGKGCTTADKILLEIPKENRPAMTQEPGVVITRPFIYLAPDNNKEY